VTWAFQEGREVHWLSTAKTWQIVGASPSDVNAERRALQGVIDELNKWIARVKGLRLDLVLWETDSSPGLHAEGPQHLIDQGLKIEKSDIAIFIFWNRFGSPTKDAQSGTEHEFWIAYNASKNHGRPWRIMVYFKESPAVLNTPEDIDQRKRVVEFREKISNEVYWWKYETTNEFPNFVRHHLSQIILERLENVPETHRMMECIDADQATLDEIAQRWTAEEKPWTFGKAFEVDGFVSAPVSGPYYDNVATWMRGDEYSAWYSVPTTRAVGITSWPRLVWDPHPYEWNQYPGIRSRLCVLKDQGFPWM
jgi:hypothetical protein